MKEAPWTTRPISPTCEVLAGRDAKGEHRFCDHPTSYAYPAWGGGWMALCWRHGQKHLPLAPPIEELIATGETFEGAEVPTAGV